MRRKKFIEYVCEKFGKKISGAVLNFVLKNRGIIESYIPSRYSLKYIEIDNIEYKTVYIDSKEGNRIEFDLVVVPEVDCSIRNIRNDDYDRELVDDLWLSVACTGDVSKSLSDFRIISVNEYSQQKPQKPLSDDLVPIIPKADYEKYAKELLEKYYPECIERLEIVDPVIIAQRMGLQILKRSIAEDGSIFGQIFFKDAEVGLFNKEHKCIEKVKVPRNTIIVDADATSLFSLGSVNITIAHECVHYYLHKKAFYFAQMLNDNLTQIQCQTSGGWKGEEETSRNNWMEIQANGIAPYILMPKHLFLAKYKELEEKYSLFYNQKKSSYLEDLIRELAIFFNVSVYAARKRLLDLGIDEVFGVLNWIDDHYVNPYFCKKGSLLKNETYTVSYKDIYKNLFTKGDVAGSLYRGDLVFVENHLCINNEKYIQKGVDGDDYLTEYARYHLYECCVKFKGVINNLFINSEDLVTVFYLCRDFIKDINFTIEISDNNSDLLNSPDLPSRYADHRETMAEIKKDIAFKTLSEILNYFVKNLKLDVNGLAIDTGLDERTIRRYLSGENKVPEKRTVIAICMVMKLPPEIIEIVLKQSHIALASGDKDDDALFSAITLLSGKSIIRINKYLLQIGAEPLTNKIAI